MQPNGNAMPPPIDESRAVPVDAVKAIGKGSQYLRSARRDARRLARREEQRPPSHWGLRITIDRSKEQRIGTTRVGCLQDQAALTGALNMLYDPHLAVLSVESLEDAEEQRAEGLSQ